MGRFCKFGMDLAAPDRTLNDAMQRTLARGSDVWGRQAHAADPVVVRPHFLRAHQPGQLLDLSARAALRCLNAAMRVWGSQAQVDTFRMSEPKVPAHKAAQVSFGSSCLWPRFARAIRMVSTFAVAILKVAARAVMLVMCAAGERNCEGLVWGTLLESAALLVLALRGHVVDPRNR